MAIYKKARGRPTFYASAFGVYDCGYDDKGNLFIDGDVISGHLDFAELPKGSTTFRNITLNQSFRAAGGIQWDGKHLAVGDFYEAMIYQFDISGKRGTEVGSTPLTGSGEVWQFFIDGDRVIAPAILTTNTRVLLTFTTIRLAAQRRRRVITPTTPMESPSVSV